MEETYKKTNKKRSDIIIRALFISSEGVKFMPLTKRQIEILMILKNQSNWITSDKLAQILETNKKTIQSDISIIVEELGENIELSSNRRNGYFLNHLDKELSKKIAKYVSENDINSSMNYRASLICTYLCFQTEFVSMQSLAETFFLSKSSVAESIKIIQRWIDRNKSMRVVISNQYGIKIKASENNILIFLSLITSRRIINESFLSDEISDSFDLYVEAALDCLTKSLNSHDFTISGDVFNSFVRLIALVVLRGKQGFQIEKIKRSEIESPVIETFKELINTKFSIKLSGDQWELVNERFLEFAPLVTSQGFNSKYAANVQALEKDIINFLNLPVNNLFEKDSPIYAHLDRMMDRFRLGHSVMNHYAHKSISTFPLEMYLIRRFMPISFGIQPTLAETGYIVDYLAEALDGFKNNIKVCLVSDRTFATIRNLNKELNEILNNKVSRFDVFLRYKFDSMNVDKLSYDIFLTTEEEFVFLEDDFIFINNSKIFSEKPDTMDNLKQNIKDILYQSKTNLLKKYFKNENELNITKKINDVKQLLPTDNGIGFNVEGEAYVYINISPKAETNIIRYSLQHYLMINQRKTKIVYVIEYKMNSSYEDVFKYFSAISSFLLS